jgi:hypothetical protein
MLPSERFSLFQKAYDAGAGFVVPPPPADINVRAELGILLTAADLLDAASLSAAACAIREAIPDWHRHRVPSVQADASTGRTP